MLSLGDVTCAVGPIGLFLGRIANFINGELWGRPADVPWAMVFPNGGPLPRHPSQLYEAGLEGLLLLAVLAVLVRIGALKRPGLIIGAFAVVYALARMLREFFREPDAQLGFLWGGATMGQLLSIPLFLAGVCFIVYAWRHPAQRSRHERRAGAAGSRNPPAHRGRRADAGRRIHGALPQRPAARLLHHRDPFGARGDFITAPEVSQMFGELIGLWMAAVWQQMGAPENVRIVELGPGRGTLLKDALRAAAVVPGFRDAVVMHLVEINPALQAQQERTLGAAGRAGILASPRSPTCRAARPSSSPTSSSTRCRSTRR